jgi:phosphate transport system permease protein
MKRVWEKIVEGILTCSGFVTSITILLIVVFLFAEALGLFNKKVIEEGYVLAVNKANPVQELSAAQIKDVFDEEITNWKELGGPDAEVKVFRLEDITSYFSEEELGAGYEKAPRCIGEIVAGNPGIIAFVPSKFIEKDFPGHLLKDESISFDEVFAGKEWFPTANSRPSVRISSFDYGYALGEFLCHPVRFAFRLVGGGVYVRGGRPSNP